MLDKFIKELNTQFNDLSQRVRKFEQWEPRESSLKVTNKSGEEVFTGSVGYLDDSLDFYLNSTLYYNQTPCVVISGGINNSDIFVARSGTVKVLLNSNCSVGQYLFLSGTKHYATPLSYMRPEVIAIAETANVVGAGGFCRATLLLNRDTFTANSADYIYAGVNMSDSDFVATIATLPGGSVLTYNAPTSGNENTIVTWGIGTFGGRLVLYNTSAAGRGESDIYILIQSVVVGTNTITATGAIPSNWLVGDTITARSQTNTFNIGTSYFYDISMEEWSDLYHRATSIWIQASVLDTGAATESWAHPFKAYNVAELQEANPLIATTFRTDVSLNVPVINNRFELIWNASGAATFRGIYRLTGYTVAMP